MNQPLSPHSDPASGQMAPGPGGALWRVLWGCLVAAGKIYAGPAVWSRFPKGFGFSVLSLVLALAACMLNGLVSGEDLHVLLLNVSLFGVIGAIGVTVREDPPWAASVMFVMLLGLLVDTPVELLTRVFASGALWGGADQVTKVLSTFLEAWMMVTLFRLCVAKIAATNKKYPIN